MSCGPDKNHPFEYMDWLEQAVETPMSPADWTKLHDVVTSAPAMTPFDPCWGESIEYDNLGRTSRELHTALRQNDLRTVYRLLDAPHNPNYADARGSSLLMVAAYRGLADVCRRLIAAGADPLYSKQPYYANEDGDSLFRARLSSDLETIEVVECAWTAAFWRSILSLKDAKPNRFLEVAPSLLKDAVRLGMVDLAAEINSHGILSLEDDDGETSA